MLLTKAFRSYGFADVRYVACLEMFMLIRLLISLAEPEPNRFSGPSDQLAVLFGNKESNSNGKKKSPTENMT